MEVVVAVLGTAVFSNQTLNIVRYLFNTKAVNK